MRIQWKLQMLSMIWEFFIIYKIISSKLMTMNISGKTKKAYSLIFQQRGILFSSFVKNTREIGRIGSH